MKYFDRYKANTTSYVTLIDELNKLLAMSHKDNRNGSSQGNPLKPWMS